MEKLFEEFKAISDKECLEKLKHDLKAKDLKDLYWLDENQLEHAPYYRNSDLEKLEHLQEMQEANQLENNWKICSSYRLHDETLANIDEKIKTSLQSGADRILLFSDLSSDVLEAHLSGKSIAAEKLFIETSLGNFNAKVGHSYTYLLDPFRDAMSIGKKFSPTALDPLLRTLKDENFKTSLMLDANSYKNAGATQVQEIAFALQHLVEYLDILSENAVDLDVVVKNMQIKLGMGTSFFAELAKVRAFRFLLNRLLSAYEVKTKPELIAEVSEYQLSLKGPYNNLLRECTQLMVAAMSSCSIVSCPSFDLSKDPNMDFGIRMARNLQIIQKEEAYLSKIEDPAAGSYYVEILSAEFAEAAWEKFLSMEAKGGINAMYESAELQKEIEKMHNQRLQDLLKGDKKILGLNIHPSEEKVDKRTLAAYATENEQNPFVALKKRNLSAAYLKEIANEA